MKQKPKAWDCCTVLKPPIAEVFIIGFLLQWGDVLQERGRCVHLCNPLWIDHWEGQQINKYIG